MMGPTGSESHANCRDGSSRPRSTRYGYDADGREANDDKENTRLIVSQIVLDTFEGLKMTYPKLSTRRRQELLAIRKRLVK
jgi:hypothetical protein